MYNVYIIQSKKDKSYYVGVTKSMKRRLQEHNRGEVGYTKSRTPWVLKWYCAFPTKKQALGFEKYLKSGSGTAFRNRHLI